jgi:hypothetical protein
MFLLKTITFRLVDILRSPLIRRSLQVRLEVPRTTATLG